MDEADLIWNRACELDFENPSLLAGDRALRDALLAHSVLQNGGLEHCVDSLDEGELARAVDGFAHFGRADVGDVLRRAAAADDEEQLEALEGEYYERVPGDDNVEAMFRARLAAHPQEFAPVG